MRRNKFICFFIVFFLQGCWESETDLIPNKKADNPFGDAKYILIESAGSTSLPFGMKRKLGKDNVFVSVEDESHEFKFYDLSSFFGPKEYIVGYKQDKFKYIYITLKDDGIWYYHNNGERKVDDWNKIDSLSLIINEARLLKKNNSLDLLPIGSASKIDAIKYAQLKQLHIAEKNKKDHDAKADKVSCDWKFDVVDVKGKNTTAYVLNTFCKTGKYGFNRPSDITFIRYPNNKLWQLWSGFKVINSQNSTQLFRNLEISSDYVSVSGKIRTNDKKGTKSAPDLLTFNHSDIKLSTEQLIKLLEDGFELKVSAARSLNIDSTITLWPADSSGKVIGTLEDFRREVEIP